jgi:hypothetical protein
MDKTSTLRAVPRSATGAEVAESSPDPWQWGQRLIALEMSWWMACWQLQLHWLSGGAPGLGPLPPWMVWHNGTEQLA